MRRALPGTRCAARSREARRPGGWRAKLGARDDAHAASGVALTVAFGVGVAVALAGCFHDKGLGIEVDVGDTHATKIELYLGKVACAADNDAGIDCTSIA